MRIRPALTTGSFMLRGAAVAFAPEEDGGAAAEVEEPAAEAETEAEAGAEEPEGATETEEEAEPVTAEAEAEPEPEGKKRVPWQVKRIDKLTAEKATLAEEARAAKEEVAALRALQAEGGAPAATLSDAEINTRARAIAEANVLNDKVNAIYDGALAKDPKLAERILTVRSAVGDQLNSPAGVNFFQALTSIDNSGEVFSALTKDVDHLAEILEMPPIQMGIELAKLSSKSGPKEPNISNSGKTKPPKPIESASATERALDDPDLPQAEFSRRRATEREARRASQGG